MTRTVLGRKLTIHEHSNPLGASLSTDLGKTVLGRHASKQLVLSVAFGPDAPFAPAVDGHDGVEAVFKVQN